MPRLAPLFLLFATLAPAQPTLVLRNGRFWTGSASRPWAQAVAISGNKILAVGDEAAVLRLAGPRTESIDLGGRLAAPGFNDAHVQFLAAARRLRHADLSGVCTLEEIQRRVKDYAERNPQREWILGSGWEPHCLPPGRLSYREELDTVVRDRPVLLTSFDQRIGWANTRALRLGEITRFTSFSGNGEIVRDPETGEPTGLLRDGAIGLISRHLPPPNRAQDLAALEEGLRLAASLGITSIQNTQASREELALFEELLRQKKLTARVSMAMLAGDPVRDRDGGLNEIAEWKRSLDGPLLRVPGVAILLDAGWNPESLEDIAVRADRLGLQIYIHARDDRGVRVSLDAFESATKRNAGRYHLIQKDRRYRIEGVELTDPRDVTRFSRLGVLPVMRPMHADPGIVDAAMMRNAAPRRPIGFPWNSLEKAGARVTFSSGCPTCLSFSPIRGIHTAVNRQTLDGRPAGGWLPEQRISVETALQAYTTRGALASFEDKVKGAIEPGKLADLVVLSQDLFRIPPDRIHETRVWMTIFDGRVTYRAGSAAPRTPEIAQ